LKSFISGSVSADQGKQLDFQCWC